MRARILGTGSAVPAERLTNADLMRRVETSNEWILARTGIRERRIAGPAESTSTFAVPAVQRALEQAGISGSEVDLIICGTVSPDMPCPATACLIQDAIGARAAAAFDMNAGCSGFVYGLSIASQYLENGAARTAVVVGAETLSKYTDWTDRSTCVLFGDAAGAVVLGASGDGDSGLLATVIHSDGALRGLIVIPGGGSRHPPSQPMSKDAPAFIRMRGSETFKAAVRALVEVSERALARAGARPEEVRWFIPHQANRRIIDAVGERLAIPEHHTYINVDRFGNTSAASIPLALDELHRTGGIQRGDLLLFSAFGAGLTWGASVVRW